jgi:hypothetical protein
VVGGSEVADSGGCGGRRKKGWVSGREHNTRKGEGSTSVRGREEVWRRENCRVEVARGTQERREQCPVVVFHVSRQQIVLTPPFGHRSEDRPASRGRVVSGTYLLSGLVEYGFGKSGGRARGREGFGLDWWCAKVDVKRRLLGPLLVGATGRAVIVVFLPLLRGVLLHFGLLASDRPRQRSCGTTE